MKVSSSLKYKIVVVICYLTALLFTYAAVSKLLDFENFQVQLGQSPLLSAFADYISILVPLIEVILALGLSLSRFREVALKGSFLLMVVFTTYIYVILHYSAYVPCSCGGVLEKMTWNAHLVFNVVFLILLIIALVFAKVTAAPVSRSWSMNSTALRFYWIFGSSLLGIVLVVLLFQYSEQVVKYSNTLTRRMPPHAVQLQRQFDLKVNSYYFAGSSDGILYLGNSTAPLQVTVIDTAFSRVTVHKIVPNDKTLPFHSPMVRIFKKHFFLYEGNVPYVFRGSTTDWNATLLSSKGSYFSYLEPINEKDVAVRFITPPNGMSILGTLTFSTGMEYKAEDLLERQFDGIFDVDGSLHYNADQQQIIYVYRYRNQFIVADKKAKLEYRGHTIDTISKAQIALTEIKSKQISTFSAPPLIVNKMSAVDGGLLYVNSTLPGKYESSNLWKVSSIIDIYDLKDQSYQSSFPIYNLGTYKMQSFTVVGNKVYALIHNQILCYRMYDHLVAQTNYDK